MIEKRSEAVGKPGILNPIFTTNPPEVRADKTGIPANKIGKQEISESETLQSEGWTVANVYVENGRKVHDLVKPIKNESRSDSK